MTWHTVVAVAGIITITAITIAGAGGSRHAAPMAAFGGVAANQWLRTSPSWGLDN